MLKYVLYLDVHLLQVISYLKLIIQIGPLF